MSVHPAPLRLLHEAELQIMVRDGDIVCFGHQSARGYASVADQITPQARAETLEPLLMGNCAVGGASAVWVHGGGPPPLEVTLATARGSRSPQRYVTGVRYRSTAPPERDVMLVGRVRVVRPRQALFDLLHDPEAGQATIDLAVRLLALDPVDLLAERSTVRRPYASLARRRAALARPY